MNKDAILASIIGFGIGLLITGGVIVGPRLISQFKNTQAGNVASATTQQNTNTTPTPQSEPESEQTLTIEHPVKESILYDANTSVSGKAPKNAMIIVGSTEDEKVVQTDDTTTYTTTVALKEGRNEISVVSIVNGKYTVERVTVYYTSEK